MTRAELHEHAATICEALGLQPEFVFRLDIHLNSVRAEVYQRHPEHGGKYVDLDTEEVAVEVLRFEVNE